MSRSPELAPFAVTSDSTLFVNLAQLATATDFESVVRAAQDEERAVFVGVILSPNEAEFVRARLDNAADETAARLVGQRRRRKRRRDRPSSEK